MQLKFATSAVVRKRNERTAVSLKNNTFSIFGPQLAGGVQQEIVTGAREIKSNAWSEAFASPKPPTTLDKIILGGSGLNNRPRGSS